MLSFFCRAATGPPSELCNLGHTLPFSFYPRSRMSFDTSAADCPRPSSVARVAAIRALSLDKRRPASPRGTPITSPSPSEGPLPMLLESAFLARTEVLRLFSRKQLFAAFAAVARFGPLRFFRPAPTLPVATYSFAPFDTPFYETWSPLALP